MDTYPLVNIALSGLIFNGVAVPLAQIKYEGKVKTYLQHYTYLNQPEYFADDDPQIAGSYDTVDIFSTDRNALTELLPQIKQRLRDAHFTVGNTGPQQYEDDTQKYHLPINIYHESEV